MTQDELKSAMQLISSMHIGSINQMVLGDGYMTINYPSQNSTSRAETYETDAEVVEEPSADEDDHFATADSDFKEDRVKHAIETALHDSTHKFKGDWGLLRYGLKYLDINFDSFEGYKKYLLDLGFKTIPSRTATDNFYYSVHGNYPDMRFPDVDENERIRRTNFIKCFMNAYNKNIR